MGHRQVRVLPGVSPPTGLGLLQCGVKLREQNALSKKFTEASQLGLRMKLWVFRIV